MVRFTQWPPDPSATRVDNACSAIWHISSGAVQQSGKTVTSSASAAFDNLRLQRWLQRTLCEDVRVDAMARKARLGRRTFLRRFERATGLKTSEHLQHLRVARAREFLEEGHRSVDDVAWAVGDGDPGAFRRVFVKLIRLTPAEYRTCFRA